MTEVRLWLIGLFVVLGLTNPAQAETGQKFRLAELASIAPVTDCALLASVDLTKSTGTATRLVARVVADKHPYCEVTGTIAPAIRFEVQLPISGWTQRYLQVGCGGLCGTLRVRPEKSSGCTPVTDGTIVLASTDMGHQGMDTEWGSDLQKRSDFAHRGVHLTALAAKALIGSYYGQAPRFSYFSGCSDGGREALVEAQRYPEDFDGIAAGAPALNFAVQNSFHHGWLAKVNTGKNGSPILTAADMPLLHAAVLKSCDSLDGLIDGQISDPRRCHFNPTALLCHQAYVAGTCLTTNQVVAVRQIYAGATDNRGNKLELGPIMAGSELGWPGVFVPVGISDSLRSRSFALDTINHLLFWPNPSPAYTIETFPFDRDVYEQEDSARRLYDASNADLKPFAARGGKLLLWHGWSDQHISPLNTVDYFARLGRTMGTQNRDSFVRLFMFPGMAHCSGGEGPSEFPLLAAIMSWVETGPAPQMLIATRASRTMDGLSTQVPMAAGAQASASREAMQRSRPVFAYPLVAHYRGSGSFDDAESFKPVLGNSSGDLAKWVGGSK